VRHPSSEVAYITLRLYDDGAMAIEGNIGDVKLATGMLDAARASVGARLGRPSILEPHGAGLVIPSRDVPLSPNEGIYPLIAVGDR
jgi:hypothetical protein